MNVLELHQITKTFGEGNLAITAVSQIDLFLKPKEIVLIMGPSGSGKTTLLSMAGAILKPTSGKVTIAGKNVTELKEKDLPSVRREHIGFIFQSFNLLASLTALENVQLAANLAGMKNTNARNKAERILNNLNLAHRLHAIPAKMSGGEKQRVAIARAIINDPKIILADEPTANLDSKTGHDVMARLKDIAKKKHKSVLIVSHDNRIRDIADRVLWLEDGKFKEIGKMAIDPVCQMSVEKGKYFIRRRGKEYFFCSKGCLREFQEKGSNLKHLQHDKTKT